MADVVRQRPRRPNLRLKLPKPTTIFPFSAVGDFNPDHLERLHVLGRGNSGTIYKVRHKSVSSIYALKVINCGFDPLTRLQAQREVDIIRQIDSPYVIKFHGFFELPSGDIEILLEYMDLGTLDTLLKKIGTFSESQIIAVARQVLTGLRYLHANKIVHHDIKPSNLLVNKNMEVKISDFGVSEVLFTTLDMCNSCIGTCAYMSPEQLNSDSNGGNYNGFAADIWSLGITLFELYLGRFPLLPAGQRPERVELLCAICLNDPPALPESASKEFRSFMECCLKKDSSERWTASQLLAHPFLCQQ